MLLAIFAAVKEPEDMDRLTSDFVLHLVVADDEPVNVTGLETGQWRSDSRMGG